MENEILIGISSIMSNGRGGFGYFVYSSECKNVIKFLRIVQLFVLIAITFMTIEGKEPLLFVGMVVGLGAFRIFDTTSWLALQFYPSQFYTIKELRGEEKLDVFMRDHDHIKDASMYELI
jgi:hypothetical protein